MPAITNPREFPIGELARRTGVNIETIRFYERIGVLDRAQRSVAGRRSFGPAEAKRLSFVRRARELGFSLDEVRALLGLAEPGRRDCRAASALAGAHLNAVRSRIRDLRKLEAILAEAVARCEMDGDGACAVLDMLEVGVAD